MSRRPRPNHSPALKAQVALEALRGERSVVFTGYGATLCAIVVMQIVNVFLCRSSIRSIRSAGFFGSQWIGWGGMLEVVLLFVIVYTPLGNRVFWTAPRLLQCGSASCRPRS
jgi:sodium/potassium-transporting ATPase subunit alpha